MFIASIKDYWNIVTAAYKVAFLSMLVCSIAGYIGYLNIKLIRAERNVIYYKSVVEQYKVSITQMKQRIDYERENAQRTIKYYESLECVSRKKGNLTDEDVTGIVPLKPPPVPEKSLQEPKKKSFWKDLF